MSYVQKMAQNPQWANAGKVHDWRNYISEEIMSLWSSFTSYQREALVRQAQEQADKEDWE